MSQDERRVFELRVHETAARQQVVVGQRTTTLRLSGPRPIQVVELGAEHGHEPGGALPRPDALPTLAAALDVARRRPGDLLLVAGHGADAPLVEARARVVASLLGGRVDDFVEAASGRATARDWQRLLAWVAASRGWPCDPGGVDGKVGPKTRAALAAFRERAGTGGGAPEAPDDDDWRALFSALSDGLAAALGVPRDELAARATALRFVDARAVGCAAHWPGERVRVWDHVTLADERVDVIAFPEEHAPALACHQGDGACDARTCDVYRKGKYRCARCRPTEPEAGFRCLEVAGPHFDFDRSFVRPDGFASLRQVAQLLGEDPARRGLVFGHTDTVGTDAYNKGLSERRARAVLAALTGDVAAWEDLWARERWGDPITAAMLAAVGEGAAPTALAPALKAFQAQAGLPQSGAVDAETRRRLIAAYLQVAVAQPVDAARFRDFGGHRFMGCGEANPFTADGKDEASRRVVLMVHAPEADPGPLPCRVGDLGPCQKAAIPAGKKLQVSGGADPTPFFRCTVYRGLAAACACRQEPPTPPPPKKDGPLIEAFTGEPLGAAAGAFNPQDLLVEQHTEVTLRWRVKGADEVQLFQQAPGGARGSLHHGPELEASMDRVASQPELLFVLEARKGEATATAQVRVRTKVPASPVIKDFTVTKDDEAVDELTFSWLVAGPYGRVKLLPYGKDVTAATDPQGGGMDWAPPAGDGTYTLQVFDAAGEFADARTVVWKPGKEEPPPKPDVPPPPKKTRIELFGGHRETAHDKKPVPEVKDVPATERVMLVTKVVGPYQKIYISPFPGVVAHGPGDGWVGVTPVAPGLKEQAPAPDGHYTLTVDDAASAKVKVGVLGAGAIELSPQVEWDPTLAKVHWRFVEIELKAVVGLKFKVMVGEGETLATVEGKVFNKWEARAEVAKEAKMDEVGAPDWVVARVEAVKAATGATFDLKEGKAEVTAKFEVSFQPIKPEGKLTKHVGQVVPKGEIEFVGIKIGKGEDGKWKLEKPGTVKGKIAVEWPVGKVAKERWGLPWDIYDVTLIAGFAPEASPDYLQIATAVIGFDGLVSIGLIGVGVLVVVEVIRLGIRVGEYREAHQQRKRAEEYFAQVKPGIPEGMNDPSWENKPGSPPAPAGGADDAATRRARGRVFGMAYRAASLDAYRQQPDLRQALNGMRDAAEQKSPPPTKAEIDRELEDYVMLSFHREWKEKFSITLARVNHELWLVIRKEYYWAFAKDTPENPIARDIVFRHLFMDGRSGFDYDFPEVDDDLFEAAMRDQWVGMAKIGSQPMLEAEWTKAGYTRFPPDRLDRAAKREKRKDETGITDLATGKPVPLDQASTREALLQQLRDRGVYPRKTGSSEEVTAGLAWKSLLKCHLHVPGNPNPQDCATGDGTTIYNPILFKIFSSDHGREWVLADVSKPAWVTRNPIQT